jgi:adenylate cyclase
MQRVSTAQDNKAAGIEGFLHAEANAALIRGGLYASIVGLLGASLPALLMLLGIAHDLWLPVGFALAAGAYSFAIFLMARAGRARGWVVYAVMLPFVSLPTFFFVATHFLSPAGAATYITGPISYLYFVLIIVTGFMFNPRLSLSAGLTAAAGYGLASLLARDALLTVTAADPVLQQDLTRIPLYMVKSFMMLVGGGVMAGLTVIVRRTLLRILQERQKTDHVSKLFGQYVSEEVKDKLIQQKTAVVGERREVVVLFSDIRAFTSWSEKDSPEEVVERLNEYFDAMVDCITANGGVVDKFIGDAIMAVFGGVMPLPAPGDSAVAAAVAMRQRLRALNAQWQARGIAPLDNGIGMDFGVVLQGNIGSRRRKDFTVIGDTVNTASRLESLTKEQGSGVLVTSALTATLGSENLALCTRLGLVKVKGKQEEVEIWSVRTEPRA